MNVRSTAVALVMSVLVTLSSIPLADAQMGTLANPLPTTLVLVSPMPGEAFGDRMVITFGVGRRKYKFLVADAYVDDPVQLAHFTDVWEYVRTHQPNFVVQGPQSGV
ncbi:MAG TPA: hypothetical protein VEJ86_04295, partial [Candidatus Binataceae bacterium]|nr:hypothetical protein [Candidatus Binataceae bacterium]